MRNFALILCLALVSFFANGQQVVTVSNLNIRSAPSTEGKIVHQIPKGSTVQLSDCQSNWCKVEYSGYHGFVSKRFTTDADNYKARYVENDNPPRSAVKHYTNSKGKTVQSPTHYDSPPSGATAQCRDGSYSFS